MKKGFTLIEILGVVVLLGVIALISVPTINIVVKNSKQNALNQTIEALETAAYSYSDNYSLGYSSKTQILEIDTLKATGFITDGTIINPVTNSELEGCIFYRWDENYKQYQFNYTEECILKDLEVSITNADGIFNDLGWANEDFYVKIETTGSSYSYCVSDQKCNPKAIVNSSYGSAYVTTEGESIYVCAYAIDGNMTSEVVCSEEFKLDKTTTIAKPTITASDDIESGEWHTEAYTLNFNTTTNPISGIKYYYGTDKNSLTNIGSSISINTNVETLTYFVKACNGAGICSDTVSYIAKFR